MTYEKLFRRIADWIDARGEVDQDGTGAMLKLVEEVGELTGMHVKDRPLRDVSDELADVMICLLWYAHVRGVDPLRVAHDKMAINESRRGKINRFGVFVKEADLG